MRSAGRSSGGASGYAMAALLVTLAIMAVAMTAALPTWRQMIQREREDELIFRGQQYVRAIGLYQRRFGPTFPPNMDVLVEQHLLRRKYTDPVNGGAEFEVLYQGSLATVMPGQGATGAARPGTAADRTGQSSSPMGSSAGFGRSGFGGGTQTGTGTAGRGSGTGSRTGLQLGPGSASGIGGQRGGVVGVVSKSTAKSVKLYNGRNYYNEWQFVFLAAGQPGMGGAGMLGGIPGQPRGPGALPPTMVGPGGRRQGGPGGRGRGGQQEPFGPGERGGQRGFGSGTTPQRGAGSGFPVPPTQPTGRRGGN